MPFLLVPAVKWGVAGVVAIAGGSWLYNSLGKLTNLAIIGGVAYLFFLYLKKQGNA